MQCILRSCLLAIVLTALFLGCSDGTGVQQPSAEAQVSARTNRSVPEVRLASSLWANVTQEVQPGKTKRGYVHLLDLGLPPADEEERIEQYYAGLEGLGWRFHSASGSGRQYQKGQRTLHVAFDRERHPTTLILTYDGG